MMIVEDWTQVALADHRGMGAGNSPKVLSRLSKWGTHKTADWHQNGMGFHMESLLVSHWLSSWAGLGENQDLETESELSRNRHPEPQSYRQTWVRKQQTILAVRDRMLVVLLGQKRKGLEQVMSIPVKEQESASKQSVRRVSCIYSIQTWLVMISRWKQLHWWWAVARRVAEQRWRFPLQVSVLWPEGCCFRRTGEGWSRLWQLIWLRWGLKMEQRSIWGHLMMHLGPDNVDKTYIKSLYLQFKHKKHICAIPYTLNCSKY